MEDEGQGLVEELVGLPCTDPSNFSEFVQRRRFRKEKEPRQYIATNDKTEAPFIIKTDQTSFLIRQFMKLSFRKPSEEVLRRKRTPKDAEAEIQKRRRSLAPG
eukprot:jgi/Botrbrau1/10421/Bobra.0133s0028.1